jgi:tetratricopeptide (TPR) repeat protein
MTHYDEEALFEYVEGTSPNAGDIESHVSTCGRCSAEVGEQRDMIAQLATEDVWQSGLSSSRHVPSSVSVLAEQMRREEEEAEVLCGQILTGPSSWWPQRLRKEARALTGGMVKQLLERMRQTLYSSPANALQITALAIEVSNALDVVQYPSDYVVKLRAQAYRDHAYVLSFMGRYPEALDFADRSGRLFEQVPLPEYDLARLALVKASILSLIDRSDEAVALTRRAAETFDRFGDHTRALDARITEGAMLYTAGHIEDALAVWTTVEREPALDHLSAVRLKHNIATCYADLQKPELAADYVQDCIVQFELLGMETERTRSRWLLAHALVSCGKFREASPILRKTWQEFQGLDMTADAGLAALELAEALLVEGKAEEVPAICREVIARFTAAGMASRAITALSFLREAVAIGQATPSLIRHVHAFLSVLPGEQPRLFAPSPAGPGA